ncbi:MAG: hypothetical protein V3W00_03770 [Candidatus Brocadiales bacterium]
MRRFCLQFLISLLPAIPAVAQEQSSPTQNPPLENVFELDKTIPDTPPDQGPFEIASSPSSTQDAPIEAQAPLQKIFSAKTKVNVKLQRARAESESVMAELRREIGKLETKRNKLEEEAVRGMAEKEVKEERVVSGVQKAQASQLEEAAKETVAILSEQLVVLRKRLHNEEELLVEREADADLMERKARLRQEVKSVSTLEAVTAREEIGVAEAYLQEVMDREESRREPLDEAEERLEVIREEEEEIRDRISHQSELLETLPFQGEETAQRFVNNIRRLHEMQLANIEDRVATAEQEVELYRTSVKKAKIEMSNARLRVEVMRERAALLKERLKTEELGRMAKEIQRAQRMEEKKKKEAGLAKKAIEAERAEALKRAAEITRHKDEVTSREERQTLELEAMLYEIHGDIAKKKKHHIIEELRRYEADTGLKKLNRKVARLLGGENTQAEVTDDLSALSQETERWERKLEVVNSLADATQKEKHLLTERLKRAQEEIAVPPGGVSKVAREAADFKDQTLAEKYIAFANERVKLLEEDLHIIEALSEKIQKERREVILQGLQLLSAGQDKLSDIEESNVWVRREWSNSFSAMKSSIARVSGQKKRLRLVRMPKWTSETKVHMLVAIAGIVLLVAATACGSYYGRKWCKGNLAKLKEVNG